jgi:hypothetical protein
MWSVKVLMLVHDQPDEWEAKGESMDENERTVGIYDRSLYSLVQLVVFQVERLEAFQRM